jgi:hypothetical protein
MWKTTFCLVMAWCLFTGCTGELSATTVGGNLESTLTVDRHEGHVGEPVQITFTVKNSGRIRTGTPYIIELKSKPVMDIVVGYFTTDYARWSTQQSPTTSLYHLELSPGQSQTISLIWMPDEQSRNKPVRIQGIVNLKEEDTADVRVLLQVK